MGVFDKSVKIGRNVPDPTSDKDLPAAGGLSWGGIKTPAGLAGTTGADAKAVTGDLWEQLTGNVMSNVTQDRTHNILGSQTSNVTQNRTDSTVGTRTQTTIGQTMRTFVGPTVDTFTTPQSVTHAAPQNRMEPTAYLHSIMSWFVNHMSYTNVGSLYFQAYVMYELSLIHI